MKIFKVSLISAAFLLFVIACSQASTTNTISANNAAATVNANAAGDEAGEASDELAKARKIYSEQCAKCHKSDGTGGFSTVDGKRIKAPNFTSERMKRDSDADWIETIENGAPEDGMPAYKGKISDADIKKIVRLIRRDFQGK